MTDERPPVWVGHVVLEVSDLERAQDFWTGIGMRPVERNPHVSVLELRGGTHLILLPSRNAHAGDAPFDLMVDDLDAAHAAYTAGGFAPSAIEQDRIHDSFTLTDPDGHIVRVNSTHVVGPV